MSPIGVDSGNSYWASHESRWKTRCNKDLTKFLPTKIVYRPHTFTELHCSGSCPLLPCFLIFISLIWSDWKVAWLWNNKDIDYLGRLRVFSKLLASLIIWFFISSKEDNKHDTGSEWDNTILSAGACPLSSLAPITSFFTSSAICTGFLVQNKQ